MTGCPYRAKITSPCSVTLNRPSTEPGAWASTARPAGPPPRPERPAPAVEQGQPHVVAGRPAGQLGLRVVQRAASRRPGPSSLAESE